MRRISLAVLILPLLAVDPTLALAMGGGGAGAGAGGGASGGSGAAAGGSSGGTGGNGAPTGVKGHVVTPAVSAQAYEHPTSDAVKDPLLVQTRPLRSDLLERPGRQ
jgi:hypothetical protein